jgi:UDP-glucose 4-epimerase
MKYLITGGAGFIGSHLIDELLKRGQEVLVFDDFSTGSSANLKQHRDNANLSVLSGSILNRAAIADAMKEVDGCFHLAAAVGVEKILKDPIGSLKTNIHGTENVLDSASSLDVPVLLASTSEIYGKNSSGPLSEDSDRIVGSPLLARWTYSEAKALDESYARALFENHGLRVKIIRFFNTVGPRQSSSYGMVIPKFFQAALTNKPMIVHGDGTQQRIFCHVQDAVSGTLALWEAPQGDGEVFNLGGSEEIRVIDLAMRIREICESESIIQFKTYAELRSQGFEDISRRLPDTRKLRLLTGWRPQRDLEDILIDYFEYAKEIWK